MDKITTTLRMIKAHDPCKASYEKLVKSLGGPKTYGMDTPVTFQQIYDSNGYDDTLWCLCATEAQYHYLWRHFAVDVAQAVEHLMTDQRSKDALVVARLHADGKATDEEVAAASVATWAAAKDSAKDSASAAQIELLMDYCRLGKRPPKGDERLKRYIAQQPTESK